MIPRKFNITLFTFKMMNCVIILIVFIPLVCFPILTSMANSVFYRFASEANLFGFTMRAFFGIPKKIEYDYQ